MRDTSDMMEDALSEDTMMDCRADGGGGLQAFVDLATDVADSSPTIRDAAERLLTLLGVDDDNEDVLSSSEDEGVELDIDELEDEIDDDDDDDEDDSEGEKTRLLHQLAASLAEELKYSHKKQNGNLPRIQGRNPFDGREQTESMDLTQDTSYHENSCLQDRDYKGTSGRYRENAFYNQNEGRYSSFGKFYQNHQESEIRSFVTKDLSELESTGFGRGSLDHRLRMDDLEEEQEARSSSQQEDIPASWGAGWDACATEALRYLVEDEGLPPHDPTVLAMKDHLNLQRERAFAQYTT